MKKVYVNIHENIYPEACRGICLKADFEALLDLVAIKKKKWFCGEEEISLLSMAGKPCRHRTKRYIIQETNCFLQTFGEAHEHEYNMKSRTSFTQIGLLEWAFDGKHRHARISGHGLVILYIIYKILYKDVEADDMEKLQKLSEYLNGMVDSYLEAGHMDDMIGQFLSACHLVIKEAYADANINIPGDEFPRIPKENLRF